MVRSSLYSLRGRTIPRLGRIGRGLLWRSILPGEDRQGRRGFLPTLRISRILLFDLCPTSHVATATGCLGDQGLEGPHGSTAPGQRRRLGGRGSRRTSRFPGAPGRRTAISSGRGSRQIEPQSLRRRLSVPRISSRACQVDHCRLSGLRRRDGHGQLLQLGVRRLTQRLGGLHTSRAAIERAHGVRPRLDAGRRVRDHLSFMVCVGIEVRVMGDGGRSGGSADVRRHSRRDPDRYPQVRGRRQPGKFHIPERHARREYLGREASRRLSDDVEIRRLDG